MNIFETLRLDHAGVRNLMEDLIDGDRAAENWPEVFYDLKLALVAHNRAEEQVFYDVLNRIPNREELADIKTEEHHMAEEILQDLEEMSPSDRDWDTTLGLLKNQIESHIAEEETFVFAVIEAQISDEEAETMSEAFERARTEVMQTSDYLPRATVDFNPAGRGL